MIVKFSGYWGVLILFSVLLVSCRPQAVAQPITNPPATAVAHPTPLPPTSTVEIEMAEATAVSTNLGLIPPNDPLIHYIGRFNLSDPQRAIFDWPGTGIAVSFLGSSLTLLLDDNQNLYNVTVDGQTSILQTRPGQQTYTVAQGLADNTHTLRLIKRTEPFDSGAAAFLGLQLDDGRGLTKPPPAPNRRLEFIGDSITAGYGNEGNSPTCNYSFGTQNAEQTYAALTARELGAEYSILADSGRGVVRNYNDSDRLSQGTMISYFDRSVAARNVEDWDFTRWTPDAVIINLGTNDFSTSPQPPGELFLNGYTTLIGKIRNRYPQAHIFAVGGPIMLDPAEATIHSAVEQMRRVLNDNRVHYVQIENTLALSAVDYGCDWHPNVSGHQKIAAQLTPVIAAELGW